MVVPLLIPPRIFRISDAISEVVYRIADLADWVPHLYYSGAPKQRVGMANALLLQSSIVCTLVHLAAIAMLGPPPLLAASTLLGCLTSCCNHALTHRVAQWADRGAMVVCIVVDAWHGVVWALGASCACYAVAKVTRAHAPHLMSHTILTFAHTVTFNRIRT